MGEDKTVTTMVLKVDLQCEKCYRKVKKVLCKFPQIRDQTYDEKNNQVTIKVVSCSPEKFRDKLYCKGRCIIKCIEIIIPPPPKPTPSKPTPSKPTPPTPTPVSPCLRKCTCPPVICTCALVICICPPVICMCLPVPPPVKCPRPRENTCCTECSGGHPGGPCQTGRPRVNTCCTECSGGHPGGPCQTGYGYGVLCPYVQYVCYCGRPGYDCYCMTRPNCFSEENHQACAIM